jgi:hypothetical protein
MWGETTSLCTQANAKSECREEEHRKDECHFEGDLMEQQRRDKAWEEEQPHREEEARCEEARREEARRQEERQRLEMEMQLQQMCYDD